MSNEQGASKEQFPGPRTFSFDGEGIYETLPGTGQYVLTSDYRALQRLIARVTEWNPMMPVEASLFDDLRAAAAGISAPEPETVPNIAIRSVIDEMIQVATDGDEADWTADNCARIDAWQVRLAGAVAVQPPRAVPRFTLGDAVKWSGWPEPVTVEGFAYLVKTAQGSRTLFEEHELDRATATKSGDA